MLTFKLAQRFSERRSRSGLFAFIASSSTVGIVLGCAVLIASLSMMNGFQNVLEQKLLKAVPHVSFTKVEGTFDNWQSMVDIAKRDSRVIEAYPVIKQTAMLRSGDQFKGIVLEGIAAAGPHPSVTEFFSSGALSALETPNTIVLGQGIANSYGVEVGDTLELLVADQSSQQFRSPQRHGLKVVGLFEFGGELDHQMGYVSLDTARLIGEIEQGVSAIELKVSDVFQAPRIANSVGNQLPELVYVDHWMRTQGHLYRDIELVRTVIYLVLVLVMAVACFNIVSTLVMTVTKKRPQIAMLKTMGLDNRRVVATFFWQGTLSGLKGAAWGSILGIALASALPDIILLLERLLHFQVLSDDVYFVSEVPSQWRWFDVVLVSSVAVVMSAVATLYPAWRATQIEPAQALHEHH